MLMLLVILVEANVISACPSKNADMVELRRRMWNNVVGCRTCYGQGYIVTGQTMGYPYGEQEQCPDCL